MSVINGIEFADVDVTTFYQAEEPSRNEQLSITATSSVVADRRNVLNERKLILFRNTSPNTADIITLNLGPNAATANKGIVLNLNETYLESKDTAFKVFQGVITAICATANGKLSVEER